MIYDYVIIGGGPGGLTIANTLCKQYKILLIDKKKSLGGCHYVNRINGLFSEHSPRVYSNSYLNFIKILNDMNINFYDLFTKYKYNSLIINKHITIKSYINDGKLSIIKLIKFMKFVISELEKISPKMRKGNKFYKFVDSLFLKYSLPNILYLFNINMS